MLNNKGQSLVLFVILIPVIIMLICFVVDISYLSNESNRLDNINKFVINKAFTNVNELEEEILANDKDIIIKEIKIDDNTIKISLTKNVNSIFGGIVGIKEYKLDSIFEGDRGSRKIYKK